MWQYGHLVLIFTQKGINHIIIVIEKFLFILSVIMG